MIVWETADGRRLEIHQITTPHLINIVRHCKKFRPYYNDDVIILLELVALARGVSIDQLEGEPIPWLDTDGKFKTYSVEMNRYIEVKRGCELKPKGG